MSRGIAVAALLLSSTARAESAPMPPTEGDAPPVGESPEGNAEVAEPAEDLSAESSAGSGLFEESIAAGGVPTEPVPAAEIEAGGETEGGGGLFESAVAPANEPPGSAPAPVWNYDLNGYVRGDVFVGKAEGSREGEVKAGYGEVALRLQIRRDRFGDGFAEARLRYGYDLERTDLAVDLREAYVNAYLGPVDIRLGHQIIEWGRADGFNPTNVLTPIDLRIRSPLPEDRRLANLALRTSLNVSPVRLEGIWIPLYQPVRLPPVSLDPNVVLQDPIVPAPRLSRGLGAGRFHLLFPQFEMSLSYVYGYSPLPGLALREYSTEPFEVRLTRRPYNHHVAGFDFSTAIGDIIGIRGEAAFRYPLNYEDKTYAPRPDFQFVLGLDREFGPVNVIAQYIGTYVLDWEEEEGPSSIVTLDQLADMSVEQREALRPGTENAIMEQLALNNQILFAQIAEYQHAASARVEWRTLHDTLGIAALGLVNFTTWEFLIYPRIEYRLTDRLIAYAGGEVYFGPSGTRFDWIDTLLSAGYLELRVLF